MSAGHVRENTVDEMIFAELKAPTAAGSGKGAAVVEPMTRGFQAATFEKLLLVHLPDV